MSNPSNGLSGYGGGGGKSGAGSAHTPVETPDNLHSKQYARVLDALGEGEIEGLVDGAKSVFLNQVPLQNKDLSYNFTDVVLVHNNGTQVQAHLEGFSTPQASTGVGTEIKYSVPVVRSIPAGSNLDAVQITLGFPTLTTMDTKTGDLSGAAVDIAIDLQSNGGGFVSQLVGTLALPMVSNTGTLATSGLGATGLVGNIQWSAWGNKTDVVTFTIQYRLVGAATWTVYDTTTLTVPPQQGLAGALVGVIGISTYKYQMYLPTGQYEVQVLKVSGAGAVSITNATYLVPSGDHDTISGKTTTRYQRSYRIKLTGTGPWDIRVRRLTPDSTSSTLTNKSYWDVYVGLIDSKYRYPNTALVGLQIDAAQFSAIPSRSYDVKLLRVSIPSNYFPLTRAYTRRAIDGVDMGTVQVWDGTFYTAWTDNPAWCFYDMLTNPRYGLGEFISAAQVDKWNLYKIAQYCDELVSDGQGGMEPRFTCNLYLQTQAEAYTVIANMASMFRAITYWANGQIYTVQDKPSDPVMHFTAANVIDGDFSYSGSSRRGRHTVALVSWNDPTDFYKQKVEYVPNDSAIARYGVQKTEIVAVGCSSRGQAHRMGKWLLLSEENELETISFKTGMDGTSLFPGAIIRTIDPYRAGVRWGGRTLAGDALSVTLDAPIVIEVGHTYTLSLVMPDGTMVTRVLTNTPGSVTVATWALALGTLPQVHSVWVLEADNLVPELWRVVGLTEETDGIITVSALAHNPGKFLEAETGVRLQALPTSVISLIQGPVDSVTITEAMYLKADSIINRMTIAWPKVSGAARYRPEYRKANGNWVTLPDTSAALVDLDVDPGIYYARVYALNAVGSSSTATQVGPVTLLGKIAPPPDINDFLVLRQADGTRQFTWSLYVPPLDLAGFKIRYRLGTGSTWGTMTDLHSGILQASPYESNQLAAGTYDFAIKAVDTSGNESVNAKYINLSIADPRLAGVLAAYDETGVWSGTRTGCHLEGLSGFLQPNEAAASPWVGAWGGQWIRTPATTIQYDRKFDVGVTATFTPLITATAVGAFTIQECHSLDDITYTAWANAGVQLTTRFMKVRVVVTGTWPTLQSMTTLLSAQPVIEYINDSNTAGLTGAYRIAVGDIRLPITKTYGFINSVSVTLQNVGPGWSWELIDKDKTVGPRIKIYNASNVLADAVIDATVRGI